MKEWSGNPTENQIMQVFNSLYTFKVMKSLMESAKTSAELAKDLGAKNYNRLHPAIKHLQKYGLIRVKEYKFVNNFSKAAVFMSTLTNIKITIGKEMIVSTDTKLVLHNEAFENGKNND